MTWYVHVEAESEEEAERLILAHSWGYPVLWVGNAVALLMLTPDDVERHLWRCEVMFGKPGDPPLYSGPRCPSCGGDHYPEEGNHGQG